MRRAAKADANQAEIVALLRKLGCSVQPIHMVGRGVPDLLLGVAGKNFIVELKDGSKPPSARKLTPDETDWHQRWLGQVDIIESAAQAVEFVNKARGRNG